MTRSRSMFRSFLTLLWRQPLWAIPFALFFGFLNGGRWRDIQLAFRFSLVFAFGIGLALWFMRWIVVPRLQARKRGAFGEALAIGLAYGIATLVGSYASAIAIHFTFFPAYLSDFHDVAVTGMFSLLFFALFGGIRFAVAYHRLALERARAVEQMRAEVARAELRALRAQLHPHFLFNTLNSIASLIPSDPHSAEEVTTRLADLFRYVLRASEREHALLSDELAFLRDYLEIERVRFGGRLVIEERIGAGVESLAVPSLILQPLVENAIRHGVASRPEGGRIRLGARLEGERLVLEVSDDGPGMDGSPARPGTGFGLHSVRERLRASGLSDALQVESARDRGTVVRLILPASTLSAPPASSFPVVERPACDA